MSWHKELHRSLIGIADLVNRFDVDAKLLAKSGVELDRALFPLLSRIGLNPTMNTVELANIVGRDHSTVSRQIAKLEQLGLVQRQTDPNDRRVRFLVPSAMGQQLLKQIDVVRRRWFERQFADWSDEDRNQLIGYLSRVAGAEPDGRPASSKTGSIQ